MLPLYIAGLHAQQTLEMRLSDTVLLAQLAAFLGLDEEARGAAVQAAPDEALY
jgi:hypothetical protein